MSDELVADLDEIKMKRDSVDRQNIELSHPFKLPA